MSIKPFLISLCCAFGSVVCHGQTLYGLSDVYLKNADFNANYDHAVGETGNVAQQICELPGWNKDFSVNYTIAGVYQITLGGMVECVQMEIADYGLATALQLFCASGRMITRQH